MKKHKPLMIIGILVIITLIVLGINHITRDDVPENAIQVIMEDKTYTVDIESLKYTDVQGTRVNGKGEEKEIKASGVLLKNILNELEITEFESVSVVAEDAFSAEISKDEINDETKVFLIQEEGEDRLRLIVFGDKDSKRSVSNVAQILVHKGEESEGEAVTFTDDLERKVTVENPQRVAVLLGSFADMWVLAGGEVIASADDAWDDFHLDMPEDAVNLGSTKDLNLEKLFEANPDFIIASAGTRINVEWKETLENSGIPTAYFEVSGFDDYLRVFKICTDITGNKDAYEKYGLALQEQIDNAIEDSKNRVAENGAPKVLFLRTSAMSIRAKNSQDSVLGEMLATLGCINIADSDESLLENISVEHILKEDPDFIFFAQVGDDLDEIKLNVQKFIDENPIWQELTAVKSGKVYYMDKALYNLKPNDRWGEAYEKLEELLAEGQK